MVTSILTAKEEPAFAAYVGKHPLAGIEYDLAWRDLLQKHFNFSARFLLSKDGQGAVQGVLPLMLAGGLFGKRLVSLPYAVTAGGIADSPEAYQELLSSAAASAIQDKASFVEVRQQGKRQPTEDWRKGKEVFNFSLRLSSDTDALWKRLPKGSVRWGIKKAQKAGLRWTVGDSQDDLRIFYRMFLGTRKHRGVPGYPYAFFQDIIRSFPVKIYTSFLQETPLASIFLIYHKEEVRYAFAGAVQEPRTLSLQPYHLLIWEALKGAAQKGYRIFNFGGAAADTNEGGLVEFKRKWSDTEEIIPSYYYLNTAKELPKSSQVFLSLASAVWKKLPLPLVDMLGPKLIRHFV